MIGLDLGDLLAYSDHERAVWQAWVSADPGRLAIPFQPGGRFPTIGSLLDHLFLVERRHLSRLEGATPPETTGVPLAEWPRLFEYAALVRADLRQYVAGLSEAQAAEPLTVAAQSGMRTLPRRRLIAHLLVHETRHLAQIAYAARLAGVPPPGEHDLFYFEGPT